MKKRLASVGLCFGLALSAAMTSTGQGATVILTSADFSFGFGATVNNTTTGNTWSQDENPANSSTTQGNFQFTPSPIGRAASSGGPTFLNLTLADTAGGLGVTAWLTPTVGVAFNFPISASYVGPEPSNAAATPNYRMIVEIDNISVYVTRSGGNTSTAVHWAETTPDHAATSTAMSNLPVVSSPYANPAFYTQLSWDPADYEVALGSYNESFQRMFNFVRTGTGDIFGDGIEISGRVHLIYDAVEIPEPNGLALAGLAALGLGAVLVRRRQSKKL